MLPTASPAVASVARNLTRLCCAYHEKSESNQTASALPNADNRKHEEHDLCAIISVDYDRPYPDTYRGVLLFVCPAPGYLADHEHSCPDGVLMYRFDTGNPADDFFGAQDVASKLKLEFVPEGETCSTFGSDGGTRLAVTCSRAGSDEAKGAKRIAIITIIAITPHPGAGGVTRPVGGGPPP